MLCGCSLFSAESGKEKFKNPLFYEPLDPISRIAWKTTLTPTQKIVDNGHGYTRTNECDLVENEQAYVALRCNIYSICEENGRYKTCKIDKKDHLYLYTIRPAKPKTEDYLLARGVVEENMFDEKGRGLGTSYFMIK